MLNLRQYEVAALVAMLTAATAGCTAELESTSAAKSFPTCDFDALTAWLGDRAQLRVERSDPNAEKLALALTRNAENEPRLLRAAPADYTRAVADAPALQAAISAAMHEYASPLLERATLDNWQPFDALSILLWDRLAEPHEIETSLEQVRCLNEFLGGRLSSSEQEDTREYESLHGRAIHFDRLYDIEALRSVYRWKSERRFGDETIAAHIDSERSSSNPGLAHFNACHEASEVRYFVQVLDCSADRGCDEQVFAFFRSVAPGEVQLARVAGEPALYAGPIHNPNFPISDDNPAMPRWASYYTLCPNSRH